MTSSALFMSVAESIVILPPMRQVGCARASSAVTDVEAVGRPGAERTARRGDDQAADIVAPLAGQALPDRGVLAVDRAQPVERAGGKVVRHPFWRPAGAPAA